MSKYVTKWHPQEVREAAIAELMDRMPIVGKFVEEDARKRLYAIEEPEWGEKYRRLIVGRRLTFVVERGPKSVTVIVGVKAGEKGRYYGFYIEVGSTTSPAHPYLRPAVFQNARDIVALLGD